MIEIIGANLKSSVVTITAIDCSEEHIQWIERTRDDGCEREIEYRFDLRDAKTFSYLRSWLKNQAAVKKAHPETWGDALRVTVGTVVPRFRGCYRIWDPD